MQESGTEGSRYNLAYAGKWMGKGKIMKEKTPAGSP